MNDRPYLYQGSDAPVFRSEVPSDGEFRCEKCHHLLIQDYEPADYIGVGLQCFRCSHVSFTPDDLDGEAFSINILRLGDRGKFTLDRTIVKRPGFMLASDAALLGQLELYEPREGLTLDISEEGIDRTVALYNEITNGAFEVQDRTLAKSRERSDALKFPFAWAVRYMRQSSADNVLDLDAVAARTAMYWLQFFLDATGSWQHHPRFKSVARDMGKPNSFLHTTALLLAAKHAAQIGMPLGLSLEDKYGEPNPDLYARGAVGGHIYFEVKAPRQLQTVDQVARDLGVIDGVVGRTIDGSKGQINKHRRGVVIIFSSLFNGASPAALERSVARWIGRQGHNRKSLAAIMGMATFDTALVREGDTIGMKGGLDFRTTLNPHFDGENPIIVEK